MISFYFRIILELMVHFYFVALTLQIEGDMLVLDTDTISPHVITLNYFYFHKILLVLMCQCRVYRVYRVYR